MKKENRICTRCVMDTTDPEIKFDEKGTCNHCKRYDEMARIKILTGAERENKLKEVVDKIKREGKNKEYDCIIGVSGGVDSTYVAYIVKKLGLRPLAVHLDNGWDSELAVGNIEKILKKLDIDLYTHVVDWEEFRDIQLAYLKASVVDIEVVTDHAITAAIYDIANKKRIKYFLSGSNIVTEVIMPNSWVYNKNDLRNLEAIHKRYGTVKLKTYPTMGLFMWLCFSFFTGIQTIPLLNYVDYNKKEAKKLLISDFGWVDYGGKHYESLFTKFYQAYILPTKFNIDKRKAHLSTLICSGQITREEALEELEKPLYEEDELERDKEYVLKKFGISEKEFEDLMKLPIKRHQDYKTDEWIYLPLSRMKKSYTALLSKRK
jgi:N-acetyl sugar amidotransferase